MRILPLYSTTRPAFGQKKHGRNLQKQLAMPLAMAAILAVTPSCNSNKQYSEYTKAEANELFAEKHSKQKLNRADEPYTLNCPCRSCDSLRVLAERKKAKETELNRQKEEIHYNITALDFYISMFNHVEKEPFIKIVSSLKIDKPMCINIGNDNTVVVFFKKDSIPYETIIKRTPNGCVGLSKKALPSGTKEYSIFRTKHYKENGSDKIAVTQIPANVNSVRDESSNKDKLLFRIPSLFVLADDGYDREEIEKALTQIKKITKDTRTTGKITTIYSTEENSGKVNIDYTKTEY